MDEKLEHVKADEAEIVDSDHSDAKAEGEFIEQPAKVMRVGSMLRQRLEALKAVKVDAGCRARRGGMYVC